MKAVQVVSPNNLQIIDMEMPVVDRTNNVLVRMTAAGICGSDVGIYHGTNAAAVYPRIIGHEMVGVIQEITGDPVGPDGKTLQAGDRVIIDQVHSCGHCYPCRKNRGNVCDNLQVRGVHIDGGYREYMAVPAADCYLLPEGLSDTDAVMIEPATIAIQVCSRAELEKEDRMLIYGAGALGMSILRIARQTCDHIIMADITDEKLAEARAAGARYTINSRTEDFHAKMREYTGGRGSTVSVDAVCQKQSMMTMLEVTGNAGRVMSLGFDADPVAINPFLITSKELDLRGSRLQNKMFGTAIRMIRDGRLDLTGSVSHTFPLIEAQKAFDFVDTRDPSIRKVALTFTW